MAQTDYIAEDQNGASFLSDLADILLAIASSNKGNSRPPTAYAGEIWIDDNTPSSTTWTLNMYDGADDIKIGEFNTTTNKFMPFVNGSALSSLYATLASPAMTGTPTAPTASAGTNTTQIATCAFALANGAPTASVISFAGSSAPTGWLMCYGQAVSRTTYSALFAVVSTTYGSGDGSTTFNLPDLRGRTVAGVDNMGGSSASRITSGGSGITGTTLGAAGGAETHTLTTGQLAAHTHQAAGYTPIAGNSGVNANHYLATGNPQGNSDTGAVDTGSAGSGQAHNNTQPTMMLNYIIKI